jgi:hypothetical protein
MLADADYELRSSPAYSSMAAGLSEVWSPLETSTCGGQTKVSEARLAPAINQHIVLFEVMSMMSTAWQKPNSRLKGYRARP